MDALDEAACSGAGAHGALALFVTDRVPFMCVGARGGGWVAEGRNELRLQAQVSGCYTTISLVMVLPEPVSKPFVAEGCQLRRMCCWKTLKMEW